MEFNDLRYYFEHKMLPNYLDKSPNAFITGVSVEKEAIINRCFKDLCESNECEYPFTEQDFKVELIRLDNEILLIKIDMPNPTISPQCNNLIIIFSEDLFKHQYFTVEHNEIVNGKFLCSWKGASHLNYGVIENDSTEEILAKIYMIFKQQ